MKVDINHLAIKTIQEEARAISNLAKHIDSSFSSSVEILFNMKGRAIVTGIGKSAIIAEKIVATFNSTGTPAIFMHAADAIHGDLGIIQPDDVIICLSKSGNTPEIKVLVPLIRNMGNKLIAIVSNAESYLAQKADLVIRATVESEACPNNLAPTSSTTAQLVIGDALAVCLLNLKGFSPADFARFHPGGSLGKKLYMRVDDIFDENILPKVSLEESIQNVIVEISSKRMGATAVIDPHGQIAGIVTDGDLRRMLQRNQSVELLKAKDILSTNPKTIQRDELAINAFNLMEKNKITQLLVTENGKYVGMIHLHDILREGIV
ncbi:MAG TPA: KpsF/GutQ family sugar-phosphate isomerase [Tenuifilaceae bacterium]|nr:KpsF/GutQ family sugar-phosphate isomerase [Tenuifilaceae bacterium]HPE17820.1 KpsF/GutQ family sugar-phosphate isomerase [Tenuifilaceae bacterium]HPJ45282.1 KpsF/GutQ family sugar-phosphate isomerase [Tenuifilaceae bacterium]HPQ33630.1 KpsF/GutQ family sugar-phosphate isomerase [Tenuifilaceae bacterium]HRX67304.1 KpsF/GutQ family sugar-phosphate isomerase [Tenuifilaceae bacterium]